MGQIRAECLIAGVLEGHQAHSILHDATGDTADCKLATYQCRPDKAVTILYSLLVVVLAIYFAGAFYNVREAFRAYRGLPYLEHRQINRHLRMQVLSTAYIPRRASLLPVLLAFAAARCFQVCKVAHENVRMWLSMQRSELSIVCPHVAPWAVSFPLQAEVAAMHTNPCMFISGDNLPARTQTRLDGLVMAFFAVCVVCLLFVSYAKCSNYLLSWCGRPFAKEPFLRHNVARTNMCMMAIRLA